MYRVILSFFITFTMVWAGTGEQPPKPDSVEKDDEFFFSKKHKGYNKYAKGCLKKSYISAIGKTKKDITKVRNDDLDYSSCVDAFCCCSSDIRDYFEDKTEDITHKRVNPAVDNLIKSLRNQRMSSDIKIEELVHLKYANAIYSFYDDDDAKQRNEALTMPKDDDDGCKDEIKFRELKEEDLQRDGVQREGILKEMLAILHALKKSGNMLSEKNSIKMVK